LPPPKIKQNYMRPIHNSGCLHQSWKLKTIGTTFVESHKKELRFTLSMML